MELIFEKTAKQRGKARRYGPVTQEVARVILMDTKELRGNGPLGPLLSLIEWYINE